MSEELINIEWELFEIVKMLFETVKILERQMDALNAKYYEERGKRIQLEERFKLANKEIGILKEEITRLERE